MTYHDYLLMESSHHTEPTRNLSGWGVLLATGRNRCNRLQPAATGCNRLQPAATRATGATGCNRRIKPISTYGKFISTYGKFQVRLQPGATGATDRLRRNRCNRPVATQPTVTVETYCDRL